MWRARRPEGRASHRLAGEQERDFERAPPWGRQRLQSPERRLEQVAERGEREVALGLRRGGRTDPHSLVLTAALTPARQSVVLPMPGSPSSWSAAGAVAPRSRSRSIRAARAPARTATPPRRWLPSSRPRSHRTGSRQRARSAGVAQRRRDARRSSAGAAGAGARAPRRRRRAVAAEQLDLDRVHRVDVRVAQPDERWIAGWRSSSSRASTISSTAARVRSCSAAIGVQRPVVARRGRGTRARCPCSTWRASSRGSRRASGRTASRGTARAASPARGALERGAAAVPGGQQAAVLRPREDPRDRAQRAEEVGAARAHGGARADLEQRELVDRREGAEEGREAGVVPDERAVRGLRARREVVDQLARARGRLGAGRGRERATAASPRAPPRGCAARARAGRT